MWQLPCVVIVSFLYRVKFGNSFHSPIIVRKVPRSSATTTCLHAEIIGTNTQNRGKVNEIDFCMAPSDVTLSRSYATASAKTNTILLEQQQGAATSTRILSLTRALNSASNRALRRILLSRSWPSAEALNMSLRLILASTGSSSLEVDPDSNTNKATSSSDLEQREEEENSPKCPVPRPILNILMRRTKTSTDSSPIQFGGTPGNTKRTDEEWIADQIASFRTTYSAVPGYSKAEAYLECILSLATSGIESPKSASVLAGGVYDEAYKRFIAVLQSAGVQFIPYLNTSNSSTVQPPLRSIARKLIDQDICLSLLDKISMDAETRRAQRQNMHLANNLTQQETGIVKAQVASPFLTASETTSSGERSQDDSEESQEQTIINDNPSKERKKKFRFAFWKKQREQDDIPVSVNNNTRPPTIDNNTLSYNNETSSIIIIENDDLGGVLLSSKEPTMTRQLNVLSNVIQRTLLFGGYQELLVLYETLDADKSAFVRRWYPCSLNNQHVAEYVDLDPTIETRLGVQYFNCLLRLLKDCYIKGVITDLSPPFPLSQSYSNAFERLTASLVEIGSGYVRPMNSNGMIIKPKNAKEELGRFAEWERKFRQGSPTREMSSYPDDLVGRWLVKDEVQGKTIGVSTVTFEPEGVVHVDEPLYGLRWRLDPGPTHLDTCTFQVLGEDGAILQYKGFVDRGARLEARFSGRSITIRGEVRFQMRDSELAYMGDDYRKDMLPLLSNTGRTRFVMSKESGD